MINDNAKFWYSGEYTELQLSWGQANQGSHSGSCDEDITELRKEPSIKAQIDKLDFDNIKKELREFGAWSDEELDNKEDTLDRFLWIACGQIVDENLE